MIKTNSKHRVIRTFAAVAAAVCMSVAAIAVGGNGSLTANAATRRTKIATELLMSNGEVSVDWVPVGEPDGLPVTNNGTIFEIQPGASPDSVPNWIHVYDPIEAGKGYTIAFDIVKFGSGNSYLNLDGACVALGSTTANIYWRRGGFEFDTNYCNYVSGETKWYQMDGTEVDWTVASTPIQEGKRFVFGFRPSIDGTEGKADFLWGSGEKGTDVEPQYYIKDLVAFDSSVPHYAKMHAQTWDTAPAIDTLVVKDLDGKEIYSNNFDDGSKITSTGIPAAGMMHCSGGSVKKDTFLTVTESAGLVSYLSVKKDERSQDALSLSASVRLDAGKGGILFGMKDEDSRPGDEGTSFLYFGNDGENTYVNLKNGSTDGTPVNVAAMSENFANVTVGVKTDGTFNVKVGETTATFSGSYEGKIGLFTEGEGSSVSFEPAFTADSFAYVEGHGATLMNNFNTGYINENNYLNDTHNAVTLGANAHGIHVVDGVLLFDGTSDGTFFSLKEDYADFILQFDWINYAWEDRPTNEAGEVNKQTKPADGLGGAELYSPLGISFGMTSPNAGWNQNFLIRIFDYYNLIQFMDKGAATNVTMGNGFTGAGAGEIQPGMIAFYEQTVNIKLVVRNNRAVIYGAVHTDRDQPVELVQLGSFAVENYSGYVGLSTSEAGYFGIDNFRITNIDGWTDEQVAGYQDFVEIPDEQAPTELDAPALTIDGNTVTWTAVEHATGYKVYVNDAEAATLTAEETSYTITETEAGTYTVKVIAIGDGELYLDSVASAPVEYTVEGQTPDSSTGSGSGSDTGSGTETPEDKISCSGGITAGGMAFLAVLGAAAFIRSKKSR